MLARDDRNASDVAGSGTPAEHPRPGTAGESGVTSRVASPRCLLRRFVRGFSEQGEPVRMLPRGRLPATIEPIVSGATRATEGRDNLRGSVTRYVVSESHWLTVADKNKSAMPKIILATRRQCRHIENMKEAQRLAKTHSLETLYEMLKGYGIKIDTATGLALASARRRYWTLDDAITLKKKEAA